MKSNFKRIVWLVLALIMCIGMTTILTQAEDGILKEASRHGLDLFVHELLAGLGYFELTLGKIQHILGQSFGIYKFLTHYS